MEYMRPECCCHCYCHPCLTIFLGPELSLMFPGESFLLWKYRAVQRAGLSNQIAGVYVLLCYSFSVSLWVTSTFSLSPNFRNYRMRIMILSPQWVILTTK